MKTDTAGSFDSLGLAPKLLDAVTKVGYEIPTPIQAQAIPYAVEGEDIIGIAQTGTGKTMAFGLPMIQRIARIKKRGLCVLPTRELAEQVETELHKVAGHLGLRTAVLIGGENIKKQFAQLKRKPHIIVATPGRLIDHMQQRTVSLGNIGVLVLDEADRMLDMGFMPQIRKILAAVPKEHQTLLFSATMPEDIVRIADKHMKKPVRVEVAPQGTAAENVDQELFVVDRRDKPRLLEKLLTDVNGTMLIFTRTKYAAKKVARIVNKLGHRAAEIHSNRSQNQRREALDGFKSGKYRVLVATDIASRGIDVKDIELVINYDVPENAEDYVHRIGRTGRAGKTGKAITFAEPGQAKEVQAIERYAKIYLPSTPLPTLPPKSEAHFASPRRDDRYGSRSPRRGRESGRRGRNGRSPASGRTHAPSHSKKTESSDRRWSGQARKPSAKPKRVQDAKSKRPRKGIPVGGDLDQNISAALGNLWPGGGNAGDSNRRHHRRRK